MSIVEVELSAQQTLRREFRLPEGDEEELDASGRPWETIVQNDSRWVILHEYQIPTGYAQPTALLAVQISPSYPDGDLDMAYFHPHLSACDNRSIGGLSEHSLDGKNWQRWSRHRTPENPWRPGVDNISTHLLQVDCWLSREFEG